MRALQRFIGMVGFYSQFITGYFRKAAMLHILKKKGGQFIWWREHQSAFESLKQALCEASVLQIPDFNKESVLETDASDLAISYYSRLLTLAESKYSTYETECLAAIFDCENCCTYLEHKEFELHCHNLAFVGYWSRLKTWVAYRGGYFS